MLLLSFLLILNFSVRSLYSHTNSYGNAVTQCHVDDAERALASYDASCGSLLAEVSHDETKETSAGREIL